MIQFNPIPISEILTMQTALLILAGLAISLVGATVATAARHWSSQNWRPGIEDVWYYILSGSIGTALVLFGADTLTIMSVTTGVNTPLAVLKTTIDKLQERKLDAEIAEARDKTESNEARIIRLESMKGKRLSKSIDK